MQFAGLVSVYRLLYMIWRVHVRDICVCSKRLVAASIGMLLGFARYPQGLLTACTYWWQVSMLSTAV
jgi:hypothetical protein